MILYHSSYTKIDKFELPYNGLHLGSLKSSIEAGLRKAYKYDSDVYIHKCSCFINPHNTIKEIYDDLGEDWQSALEDIKQHNKHWIRYTNKYEPSVKKSYLTNNAELVIILQVTQMTKQEAEDLLETLEEY